MKDIPKIKRKVSDAIDRKKSMLLDRQEVRRQSRAEMIDEFLDVVIAFFTDPPSRTPMINYSYISSRTFYLGLINLRKFEGVFDLEDLEEVLEMLAKKKLLIKLKSDFLERIGREWFDTRSHSHRGPAYKLSKNLK